MIVKDESHVIQKTLENLVDQITFSYWVICDTGSTDNTREIITDFFKEKGIPGELLQHEWQDFGHNRTLALRGAFKKADYIFIFDADDTIHGRLPIPSKLDKDFYKLKFGFGFTYYRPLLVTAQKPTKFVGVLHEYISLENAHPSETIIEGNYYVDSGKNGARSRDKDKYLKDAEILKKAYYKEVETKGGLANRYAFYCAQSYKDCNRSDDAIEWYTRVVEELNNWVQEKYYACLMLGFQYRGKNNIVKAIEYFLKAEKFDPDRTEGIFFATETMKDAGLHSLVVLLYEKHKHYNKTPQDKLFLYGDFYNDVFEFNTSLSAFFMGNRKLAYECGKKIIVNNIAQQPVRNRTFSNLRFSINEMNDDLDTLGLFYNLSQHIQMCTDQKEMIVMWNMLFKKNRELLTAPSKFKPTKSSNNRVFLSITSCKRLDLFTETVNSILNHWTDADQIDYWFCVDDNSSKLDRQTMKKLYPWFNFYMKTPEEKGHRESMNIIWNKLKELKPTYWIHMEDDFLFYIKRSYVEDSIQFLKNQTDIKQVLFNRGYAETINDVDMRGYSPVSSGFVVHEHKQGQFPYKNCHYWPHYSFRPSMIDVDTILKLGNYDSPNTFFEMDYANKWVNAGYKSAFFDMICCRHTGRLTSERNNKDIKNAYDLNEESQFRKVDPITKVVNLKRREDRKANMTKLFKEQEFTDYQFIEAFDGKTLYPTFEIWSLFRGNDFGNRLGVMGCALSHYGIWKSLLEDTSTDYYVILEDDITFTPHFKEKCEVLKEAFVTCDYLLLGYSMFDRLRKATHDTYVTESENLRVSHLQKNLYVGGTFGYSINKNGAKILVDYIEKNGIKHGIDYVVKICPDLKPMEVRPQIIFAEWMEDKKKPIDSDIQTDYAGLNFSKFETEFTFIQGVDQIGCDSYYHKKPVHECLDIALADPDCAGFNTLGFFKKSIDLNNLRHSNYFKAKDGIFVKKKVQKKPTVKIIGNWASSQTMAKETGTMPHSDVTLTWKDEADYYVILNIPSVEESYDPTKTIVFQMEPWVYDDKKRWGVKTWGEWANPDPKKFLHVHNRRFLNPATWTLTGDLDTFPVKQDDTCIILSHKKHDTGHKFRLDVVANGKIDVYGKENYHSLLNYQGPVPEDNRYNVYSKYKYVLAVENNSEVNYATEKIWEPLICECLTFYWGCPNIEQHLDRQCFVRLPTDPVKAAEIIRQAVKEDWWSQRIGAIREAKKKVMNEYGLFPVISKIIKEATTVQYYSQDGQDKYLDTNVFKSFKNGVFVDIGAHDGLSINNTIFFEKNRGWSGINVEPIKSVYDELTKNRSKSINLNCAVSNTDGNAEFICNEGYTEMISGLKDYFDPRHIKRLNSELNQYGGQTNVIMIPTKRLETILDETGIKHVHYLNIDVEGAEFEVVKSINFDKVFIDIIEFENNYNDNSIPIVNYLIEKGYSVIHRSMDIFMKHKDSKF